MTKSLPERPNLTNLKKQAKSLLKAHKAGDPTVCAVLRHLHRFSGMADSEILAAEIVLAEAQFAIAIEYGFKDWAAMKASVESPSTEVVVQPEQDEDGKAIVKRILGVAFERGASDIHLEWNHSRLTPRLRVDGNLVAPGIDIPLGLQDDVIASIKALACIDVDGHSTVQDGRARVERGGHQYDLRVSIMPYVGGESAVIRILDRQAPLIALENQNLTPANLACLRRWQNSPNGLFIVSGPTGSGKTTTLYSVLVELAAKGERKILTCEDPVEYVLDGVNQQAINEAAGLTPMRVLRGLMRQDPDVVMIGEIRDLETLQAAVQFSVLGHLVLTSMHTADAPGAVQRLLDTHIEPYLLNSALLGIMAQRLVRKLCPACREEREPEEWVRESLKSIGGKVRDFKSKGCNECKGVGYRGRAAVHEILEMSDALRTAIGRQPGKDALYQAAIAAGMIPLRTDALTKAFDGLTSIQEAMRVCGQ